MRDCRYSDEYTVAGVPSILIVVLIGLQLSRVREHVFLGLSQTSRPVPTRTRHADHSCRTTTTVWGLRRRRIQDVGTDERVHKSDGFRPKARPTVRRENISHSNQTYYCRTRGQRLRRTAPQNGWRRNVFSTPVGFSSVRFHVVVGFFFFNFSVLSDCSATLVNAYVLLCTRGGAIN